LGVFAFVAASFGMTISRLLIVAARRSPWGRLNRALKARRIHTPNSLRSQEINS
jgi:hypothetical protein